MLVKHINTHAKIIFEYNKNICLYSIFLPNIDVLINLHNKV